jgi:uncharacterized protein (TIGR02186 family)
MMMKRLLAILIVGLVCMAGLPRGAVAAAELQATLQPNEILMGASYDGQSIAVTGTLPADAVALIRVTGKMEHNHLKQKGRALGILWMNQGSVEISHVPRVFQLYLSEAVQAQSPVKSLQRLGLDTIREQAEIVSKNGDKDELFAEFVKLKQKAGLYGTIPDAIGYEQTSAGVKSFHCTLSMPSDLPPGDYTIEVFAIRDDTVVAQAAQALIAKETGMTAFISSLAFQHGTLYGVLAVLVALIAGLLTGIVFKGGKGAH